MCVAYRGGPVMHLVVVYWYQSVDAGSERLISLTEKFSSAQFSSTGRPCEPETKHDPTPKASAENQAQSKRAVTRIETLKRSEEKRREEEKERRGEERREEKRREEKRKRREEKRREEKRREEKRGGREERRGEERRGEGQHRRQDTGHRREER